MWALDNRTPFAADSGWIRDSDGVEVWIVAVNATYDILPDGDTRIASEQVPVHSGPVLHEDLRSLRYDIDLGPPKPATDVLLNGHAYAQGTQPVEELHVGFRVGSMKRLAKVSGDRYWRRGMLLTSASKAVPFMRMPLVYERAFGGDAPDAEHGSANPLGRGVAPDADGRVWLPNVELLTNPVSKPGDRPAPMSFGPIPCHWPERRQYAGTHDEAWLEQRYPLPPQDLDPRHWQLAPAAQQVEGHLRGGEEVVLVNLTPPGFEADGRLSFRLPKLTLAFQTYFTDGHSVASRSRIHTVILEPDHPRVSIVHHMALPCHEHINRLDKTRILQKRRPLDRPFSPVHADLEWPAGDDQQGANQ